MDDEVKYQNRAILGRRIREAREAQHISLRKFALMIGMDFGYLSRVENGKANVTIDEMTKISQGLDIPLRNLFME